MPSILLSVLFSFILSSLASGVPGDTAPGGTFKDDFDRNELGPDWLPRSGEWKIRDGALYGMGPDAFMVCAKSIGKNLRLEYTAWSEMPCDLSASVGNTKDAIRMSDGLAFQFGGWNNTRTRVMNKANTLWQSSSVIVKKAVRHRLVCERWGKLARYFVDGRRHFSGVDPNYEGITGDTVGFYIYSEGFIDDVVITALPDKVPETLTLSPESDAPPPGAKLVLEENFDREDIGKDWTAEKGEWKITDGALHGKGLYATMALAEPMDANIRIEYATWTNDKPPNDFLTYFGGTLGWHGLCFSFGTRNSGYSWVRHGAHRIWKSKSVRIKTGTRHRIVCEQWGKIVRVFVDGKLACLALDPAYRSIKKSKTGFYIFGEAFVDDVRIYKLSGSPPESFMPKEPSLVAEQWFGFNDLTAAGLPKGITARPSSASARTVNFPDYEHWEGNKIIYPSWKDDGCIELAGGKDGNAAMDVSFSRIPSGFVEVEFLAKPSGGRASFKLSITDEDTANPVAEIACGEDGRFIARGKDGPVPLRDSIRLPNMAAYSPVRFVPGRWYRLRLTFDAAKETHSAVIVGWYTGHPCNGTFPTYHADWVVLGSDIPFARHAKDGKIALASISTPGGNRLFVDNIYVIGPYAGQQTINGKDARHPGRVLLAKPERPRHDSPDMHTFSLRNALNGERMSFGTYEDIRKKVSLIRNLVDGKHPAVVSAAREYDELLISQAFLSREVRKVKRTLQYLKGTDTPGIGKLEREAGLLISEAADTEKALGRLYEAYMNAYLDGLNAKLMASDFAPRAVALRLSLDRAHRGVRRWLAKAGASGKKQQAPETPPPDENNLAIRNGRIVRAERNSFIFTHHYGLFWREQEELLRLDSCIDASSTWGWGSPIPKGEYVHREFFRNTYPTYAWFQSSRPDHGVLIDYRVGTHHCTFQAPKWWLEENNGDDDVFFCDENGRIPEKDGKRWHGRSRNKLNFWNPKVRKLLHDQTSDIVDFFSGEYPGRVFGLLIARETWHSAGSFPTGYNKSAREAFRAKMKDRYGEIGKLNEEWNVAYESFDRIEPPPSIAKVPRIRPSGLCYEWELFRQQGYAGWIKIVKTALNDKLPGAPLLSGFTGGAGAFPGRNDPINGFDLTQVYPQFDYFEFHVSKTELSRVPNKMLISLRSAFGGGAASLEWGAGSAGDLFDEVEARRSTEADFFRMAAGGRSFFNVWYGIYPGWNDSSPWAEPRASYTILRYMAASIPLGISRLRELERYFLEYRHVKPRVNILESNSSFLNACPPTAVRLGMSACSDWLEKAGMNYGFLWENLLAAGKQTLADTDVTIIPNGICLPDEVQDILAEWVGEGGTLIALGAPGVYDPWGKQSGKLLSATFGGATWKLESGNWMPEGNSAPEKIGSYANDSGAIYRAGLGKGSLIIFGNEREVHRRKDTEPILMNLVRKAAKRTFYCLNNGFELTLREDKKRACWYMTVLNGGPYDTVCDEIRFNGPKVTVRDVDLPAFSIPVSREGEETSLRLSLEPGEGVILEIMPVP